MKKLKITIAKLAKQEFDDAKQYYELEQSGLGNRFAKEMKEALLRIQQFPKTWPVECDEIRRYYTHKFPYKILYSVQDEQILILAFAHQHREPNYWIYRSQ